MVGKTPEQNGMKIIQENYSDEVIVLNLDVEIPILKHFFERYTSNMFF